MVNQDDINKQQLKRAMEQAARINQSPAAKNFQKFMQSDEYKRMSDFLNSPYGKEAIERARNYSQTSLRSKNDTDISNLPKSISGSMSDIANQIRNLPPDKLLMLLKKVHPDATQEFIESLESSDNNLDVSGDSKPDKHQITHDSSNHDESNTRVDKINPEIHITVDTPLQKSHWLAEAMISGLVGTITTAAISNGPQIIETMQHLLNSLNALH